jgi:nucleoside-diphosphate-sugar epimerase
MAETVLIFGLGHIGAAFARSAPKDTRIFATARNAEKRTKLAEQGIIPIDPSDASALGAAAQEAVTILITCAPDEEGCPAFRTLKDAPGPQRKWIGYLSTTGVYGDRGGGWAFEDTPLNPVSKEALCRVVAETQWQNLGQGLKRHRVDVFRLPGLYGPGRSVFDKLRDGTARRVHKPGQVFSRLHEDDCASALWLACHRPAELSGTVYNLCDDEPAPADLVMAYAAQTYGFEMPPVTAFDAPGTSHAMQRFYRENKRVSNARAKAGLGWRLKYPTYREGLKSVYETFIL